jgi:hypothetical protein
MYEPHLVECNCQNGNVSEEFCTSVFAAAHPPSKSVICISEGMIRIHLELLRANFYVIFRVRENVLCPV